MRSSSAFKGLVPIVALAALTAGAQADDVLGSVERGGWSLREIGQSAPALKLCASDPNLLLQPEHRGAACTRTVLDRQGAKTTVRYACAGAGYGQTTVTVESSKLLHIQTQGIAGGAPFDHDYEARHVGGC